jgi:hypothetical protein
VDKLRPAIQNHVVAKGTLPKHSLHSIQGDFNAIGAVRYVKELAVTLQLGEGYELWCAKVPEDLRFAVKGFDKLANFHGGRDVHHLDAICLIYRCHYLHPYA